jgi:hypothetical protein
MRTISIVFTSLFFALPAFGQAQGGPTPPPSNELPPTGGPVTPPTVEDKAAPATAASPGAGSGAPSASVGATTNATPGTTPPVVAMEGATKPETARAATSTAASLSQRGSDVAAADNSWKLEYHGYLRAPMRLGLGKRDNPTRGQGNTTYHYPVVPDDQYLNWQFTSHNKKDWAEMFFTYGNAFAKGTLALQGFNFTDAAWTDSDAQFGISQGFIELTPDLGYENFRLSAKAGSFWARYGMAGKWDSGEYDTYLFGRTHVMGALVHADYDITDATGLWFELGAGVKRPDPSQFNNARFTTLLHGHAGLNLGSDIQFTTHLLWLSAKEEDRIMRSANAVPSGSMMVSDFYNPPNYPSSLQGLPDGRMYITGLDARLELGAFGYLYAGYSHIGAKNAISVAPAVEVLHAFGGGQYQLGVTDNYFGPGCQASNTPEDYNATSKAATNPTGYTASTPNTTNGKSPVGSNITNTVPTAGYQKFPGCSMGTGTVDSLLAQYEFSLTNFKQISSGGQKFWGEGSDIKATLYGMANFVGSDIKYQYNGKGVFDGVMKLKYGADLQFALMPWLTFATRFDRVQPNNHLPDQSFMILSPRLVFKSKWVTREQITFQYSRYMYNRRECDAGYSPAYYASGGQGIPTPGHTYNDVQLLCVQPPAAPASTESFGSTYETQDAGLRGAPTTRPDVNVFSVSASMWW